MAECNFTLKIWRQAGPDQPGRFVAYKLDGINDEMSFLEMLDVLNERLTHKGEVAIEFDHDCREGICGSCGLVINGQPHGPERSNTTCELRVRAFENGSTIVVEPWRAKAFPVIKDLVVNRDSFDRIMQAGGYVTTKTGPHADANGILIPKAKSEEAMDAASCIGCGACVAACPNASASLFTGAKIAQFALLPQGGPERERRVVAMVDQMDDEVFGSCTNIGECTAACPKNIPLTVIARMKSEYLRAIAKCACANRED